MSKHPKVLITLTRAFLTALTVAALFHRGWTRDFVDREEV